MSKPEENTNELESYGVWVKNTSETPEDITDTQLDDTLDIPEFDDSEFSDMFKNDINFDETKIDENPAETSFTEDDNTTLTTDELMNIANTTSVSEQEVDESMMFANGEEISNDEGTDEVVLHDFPEDAAFETENLEEPVVEETAVDIPEIDESFDTPSNDEVSDSEATPDIDISEFGLENTEHTGNSFSDEIEVNTEANNSDVEFEEINFDSIDEPASPKEENQETIQLAPGEEEVSLDDFLEDGFSDDSVASGNNGYEPGKEPGAQAVNNTASTPAAESESVSLDDFIDTSSFGIEENAAPAEESVVEEEPILDMDLSFDDSADTLETVDNKTDDDYSDFTADDSEEVENEETTEETKVSFDEEEPYVADTSNVSTEEVDLSDFGIDSDAEETPVNQNIEEKKAADAVVDYDLAIGDEDTLSSAPVISEIKETEEPEVPVEPQPAQVAQPDPTTTNLLQQIVAELSGLKNDINKLKSEINEVKEREANGFSAGSFTADETPVVEETPIVEETPAFEETPAVEEAATDFAETPVVEEDAPVFEETSVTEEEVPAFEETPAIEEEVPVFEETPTVEDTIPSFDETTVTEEETPVFEETPVTEDELPSFDETPVTEEDTPVFDETPVIEDELPSFDETPVTEEETPVFDETPVVEEDAPVFEETQISLDEPAVEETSFETTETEPLAEDTVNEESSSDDTIVDEPVVEETPVPEDAEITLEDTQVFEDLDIPESEEPVTEETTDEGGFFTDDGDETIALSGDELANIMTTSEVTEGEVLPEQPMEETSEPIFETETEEPEVDVVENEPVENEETSLSEDLSFDFEDKNLEEPDIESIQFDETEETDSELPDEISIPKSDDIFVESNQTDFMGDVSTEQTSEPVFETTDTILNESGDSGNSAESGVQFDSPDTLFEHHFDTTETLLADLEGTEEAVTTESTEENTETTIEAPVEETFAPEPVVEESAPVEDDVPTVDKLLSAEIDPVKTATEVSDEFAEVDNLDSNISKDNIDYLNADKEDTLSQDSLYTPSGNSNEDLKRDIKSVLLYMDQLLENLPEEKIMEFAKSDEFVTYKKLFSELGLS
ncbi:MAG: hypothetical protein K6C98_01965 [Treponema sp.]|nr:hypothetical protein [Treponema sp.]